MGRNRETIADFLVGQRDPQIWWVRFENDDGEIIEMDIEALDYQDAYQQVDSWALGKPYELYQD